MKKTAIIFIFFASITFGNISTLAVSPFVNRGFSYTYEIAYFPVWDHNNAQAKYKQLFYPDDRIHIRETSYENYFSGNTYFSIGIRERVEIEIFPTIMVFLPAYFQIKFNIINYTNDENRFCNNFAITPFFGLYLAGGYIYESPFYLGISIGTRHSVNKYIAFELYSSPLIYNGGISILFNPNTPNYGDANLFTLNLPIGARMLVGKTRKFSADLGVIPIIKLKDTWLNLSPVSVYTKVSFHLGRKEKSELRKQRDQEKSELRKQRAEEIFNIPEE